MGHSGFDSAVLDAIADRGCPVCRILRRDEERYWSYFLYEGFQDPQADAQLRGSVGYCARHLAALATRNDVFACANLALASVEGAHGRLEGGSRRLLRRQSPPPVGHRCPVCATLVRSQRSALEVLGRLIADDAGAAYEAGDGVCYDHAALALAIGAPSAELMRRKLRERLELHADELRRLVRSFDHRSQPADAELSRAWRRAFLSLRGDPGRVGPRGVEP